MGRPGPNVIKICQVCGSEFHPTSSRQVNCNRPIKVPCIICGTLMDRLCSKVPQKETCSDECNIELIKRRQVESGSKLTKKCKCCGKEFHPKYIREEYCEGPHYTACELCGKQFEYDPRREIRTCSEECRYLLAQQHTDREAILQHQKENLQIKYGDNITNPMHIPGVVDKIRETNRKKYGVEWYTQTQSYKDTLRETSLARYGVEHPLSSQEIISKRSATVKEKYGVDNVFQDADVKEKSKQTSIKLYGVEHPIQSNIIKDRARNTNLIKYGVEHPMMLPEYQAKARDTNFKRFGVAAPTQSHIKNIENWYKFIADPKTYISDNYDEPPRTVKLAEDLGVNLSTVDLYLDKYSARSSIHNPKSLMEETVIAFIRNLRPDCEIIHNDRKVLEGKELDIYLPEYKFAIECNPTVSHNSSVGDPWTGTAAPIHYHKRKTNKCEEKGIFLMHLFGYDWTQHEDIMKSMISNTLGCSSRIYARKCNIIRVDSETAKIFLQNNHRQGFASTKIYLGLMYEGELVSIMTFGKMRSTIGIDSTDLSDCWELVRFCNKLNTSVIGGASKLFRYFIREYNPKQVRSFSDRAHTKGSLYKTLGFTELRRSDANYVWVNVVDDKAYHRINAQKHNIKKFLKDDTIDLNKSEREIMESHGYVRVFDSGTITWQWTCDSL